MHPAVILRALVGSESQPSLHRLAHGEDPRMALGREGLHLTRVVGAEVTGEHELTLTVEAVRGARATNAPGDRTRRDPDVRDDEMAGAVRRRRIAAYALVRREGTVLLTVLSDKARAAPGAWTMPGGGVDVGEAPEAAVVREVWEETGQRVEVDGLLGVTSDHWIGRAPDGTLEDFQPIRLLYRARCEEPQPIVVHDVGGTTASADWVPVQRVLDPGFPLVRSWAAPLRAQLS